MKVTQKKKTEDSVWLQCVASAKEVNGVLDTAHIGFAQQMGMKPEPNKTVAQAAEEQMGIKDLDSIVAPSAMQAFIPMALNAKDISPAYTPKLTQNSSFKRNNDFRFEVKVPLKPEYELKSYDPVEITVQKFFIDESLVDTQIDSFAERYKTRKRDEDADPNREVQAGDLIKISMKAFEDGKEIKVLSTEGRPYQTAQGLMPQGFDEGIYGMKVGETREIEFDAPAFDENRNETTQHVTANVGLIEFQKQEIPVIDDEWVKKYMPMYKDYEELRGDIRRNIERQQRMEYDSYIMNMAAQEAASRFEGRIGDQVYEEMRNSMLSDIQQGLREQGIAWEDFVKDNGGEQQFGMMLMLQVRQAIVQGYTLDAIFRHEKMELTEQDIDAAALSINPRIDPKQTRKQMEQASRSFVLRESAERLKANRWLVEHAKITEIDTREQVAAADAQAAAADAQTESAEEQSIAAKSNEQAEEQSKIKPKQTQESTE